MKFDYPLNLHISQTANRVHIMLNRFDYPLNLHISQTPFFLQGKSLQFDYPLNLHISQTVEDIVTTGGSLIIL